MRLTLCSFPPNKETVEYYFLVENFIWLKVE